MELGDRPWRTLFSEAIRHSIWHCQVREMKEKKENQQLLSKRARLATFPYLQELFQDWRGIVLDELWIACPQLLFEECPCKLSTSIRIGHCLSARSASLENFGRGGAVLKTVRFVVGSVTSFARAPVCVFQWTSKKVIRHSFLIVLLVAFPLCRV